MAEIDLSEMTQGAVQLEVVLNGTNLSIGKKNLSSLQVNRGLGDVANKFTLEVFDETAYQLENALAGTGQCPITVKYSASNSWGEKTGLKNSLTFSGVCTSYQISFVGRATMLSIEGILSAASTVDASISWWFKKATINWCNNDVEYDDNGNAIEVDGRPINEVNDKTPFDPTNPKDIVCAYETDKTTIDSDGKQNSTPCRVVVANPARIFRRIMETFKQVFGEDSFKYEIEECRWISGLDCIQSDETVPEFINRALCPHAVTWYNNGTDEYDKQIAGFRYYCDENGHHFKRLNYNDATEIDTISLHFGQKNSRVISFTASDVGALAMAYNTTLYDEVRASNSSTDALFGNIVTAGGENVANSDGAIYTNLQELKNTSSNYYYDLLKNNILNNNSLRATQKTSYSTYDALSAIYSEDYNKLNELPFQAQLTVWGEYSNTIKPGNFINLLTYDTNGQNHYTTGVYYITEVVDNVSSEGFIQTITMIKNTTSYNVEGIEADDTTGFTNSKESENNNVGVIAQTPKQIIEQLEDSNSTTTSRGKIRNTPFISNTTEPIVIKNPKLTDIANQKKGNPNKIGGR